VWNQARLLKWLILLVLVLVLVLMLVLVLLVVVVVVLVVVVVVLVLVPVRVQVLVQVLVQVQVLVLAARQARFHRSPRRDPRPAPAFQACYSLNPCHPRFLRSPLARSSPSSNLFRCGRTASPSPQATRARRRR